MLASLSWDEPRAIAEGLTGAVTSSLCSSRTPRRGCMVSYDRKG